jgi:hypothetical protein
MYPRRLIIVRASRSQARHRKAKEAAEARADAERERATQALERVEEANRALAQVRSMDSSPTDSAPTDSRGVLAQALPKWQAAAQKAQDEAKQQAVVDTERRTRAEAAVATRTLVEEARREAGLPRPRQL